MFLRREPASGVVSDDLGCTAWPEGVWHDCCVQHDIAYRAGGTWRDRRRADAALYRCVRSKGRPITAAVMFVGVRLFGLPAWIMDRQLRKEKEDL